jgi:hypothetical protein
VTQGRCSSISAEPSLNSFARELRNNGAPVRARASKLRLIHLRKESIRLWSGHRITRANAGVTGDASSHVIDPLFKPLSPPLDNGLYSELL